MCQNVLVQFCNACFDFFWSLGSGVSVGLGSKILNTFLLRCQSQFLIFLSAVHHFCLHCVQPLDINEPLVESLYFPQGCLLVTLMISSTLTILLEQKVHSSHHIISHFKIITESISWKWPNTKILKPIQNVLHDKWNRMCRGDNTSRIKDAIFPGLVITHSYWSTACFALKGHMTVTSRGCRWCVQCTVKVAQNVLLKMEKSQQKAYMPHGYNLPFHWQHWQLSLHIVVENNLFCIVLCASILNRLSCF